MEFTPFYIFWVSFVIVFYTYLGYGVLLFLISKAKGTRPTPIVPDDDLLPNVTLVIAAYNEQEFIGDKIQNTKELDYPSEKLQVFIVTDGSSDRTPDMVQAHSGVTLFHEHERRGKIHAVNRVMKSVTTPLVVFCDANTFLNKEAIKLIVRHYADERVGGVAGEKRIMQKSEDNASGSGEGLYWKYESFLKKKDAEVSTIVGAAGELFSVRTDLYEPPPGNIVIEDFYMSLKIVARGYRFAYEPDAYAIETASASVAEEWKRKVRITAGAFQAMGKLLFLLNPFRYGIITWQYVSHRVLRWTLAPLALLLLIISNIWLAVAGPWYYKAILGGQVCFYLLAWAGHLMQNRKVRIKGFFVPYYFAVMNLSVYAGLARHLKGSQSVVWEKSKRAV